MRLKLHEPANDRHKAMVTSVGWTPQNQLYSVGDDQQILRWTLDGDDDGSVQQFPKDVFVTDMRIVSSLRNGQLTTDLICLACADGSFMLLNSTGKVERHVEKAHSGAITAISWSTDGSSLITAGEDGQVKQWSRNGNLRSKLAQAENAVYAVCWSPDNLSIMYASGRFITVKSLQPNTKPLKWKAHQGTVLNLDWNPINNLIVSGGEDCKYKVWDSYAACLYSSKAQDWPITSVSWVPNGDYFAIGSFNMLAICDKTGWIHSRSAANCGSIMHIDFTADGTHLAGAGASGCVIFAQIIDRAVEWRNLECILNENNQIVVHDVLHDSVTGEELEFGSRVIDMSIQNGYLLVATAKQFYIHSISNFSTPHIFDLKGAVTLIAQTQKYFLVADKVRGITIYNYEGRVVSSPKVPNLLPQFLHKGNISITNDTLALIDRLNPQIVHLIDVETGKAITEPIRHDLEVIEIGLSQTGLVSDRKLVLIDRNHDVYISQVHTTNLLKLLTIADSIRWHETTDMLAVIADQKLVIMYYPNVIYVDRDLVKATRYELDLTHTCNNAVITSFCDSRVSIRRADGALCYFSISQYPPLLYNFVSSSEWGRALRLCRLVKDNSLWACLAVMALATQQLDTAEIALANIDEVDKLQYIQYIKSCPTQEQRNAAMCVYRRQLDQAEAILLKGDLIWRAIELNIDNFRWNRALILANKFKRHVDVVVAYRQRYMQALGEDETEPIFLKLNSEIKVDWSAIKARLEAENVKESKRGTPFKSIMAPMPDLFDAFQTSQPAIINGEENVDLNIAHLPDSLLNQPDHENDLAPTAENEFTL